MKRHLIGTTAILTLLALSAYDNKTAWKVDDAGVLVLKDGNPVYVDGSGKELIIDQTTIGRLNGEAKGHREAKEAAEIKLKAYEGIDPEIARKSIELAGKIDAKTLIDAGQVDKVKSEITGQFTKQMTEKDAAISDLQSRINNMQVEGVFSGSEFVRDSIAVPRDMFEASFRNNFKVEDGKVVAYDKAGNRLMSKTRAGEYAEPDEALQLLVEMHPQKDTILKANTGAGSGSGGGGGNRGQGKTMKRGEFNALPAIKQAEISGKVRLGEMVLTD